MRGWWGNWSVQARCGCQLVILVSGPSATVKIGWVEREECGRKNESEDFPLAEIWCLVVSEEKISGDSECQGQWSDGRETSFWTLRCAFSANKWAGSDPGFKVTDVVPNYWILRNGIPEEGVRREINSERTTMISENFLSDKFLLTGWSGWTYSDVTGVLMLESWRSLSWPCSTW